MRYILQLKDLQSVTVELQKGFTSEARILFIENLENFPDFLNRLSSSGRIVENSAFKSALAKI